MKRTQAPVYVRCFDLVIWLLERCDTFPDGASSVLLRDRIQLHSVEVLETLSLALAFRTERRARLLHCNALIMRLRIDLRLVEVRGILEPRRVRHAMTLLDEVGSMVGGWIRQEAVEPSPLPWSSPFTG